MVSRNGTTAYIGLPEREATKLQDLWQRDEVGVELSVEVRAPVIVGIYPLRIARFVIDQASNGNGYHPPSSASDEPHDEPIRPAPIYQPPPATSPLMHAESVHRPPAFEDVPAA